MNNLFLDKSNLHNTNSKSQFFKGLISASTAGVFEKNFFVNALSISLYRLRR